MSMLVLTGNGTGLRGLGTMLSRGSRRLKRLLLNQQAFGLEQKLKVDDGLHPGPLVPDCFKTLQYASPLMAPTAQHHLSNEPHGVVCAAQHPIRVRADRSSGSIAKSDMGRQLCGGAHVP